MEFLSPKNSSRSLLLILPLIQTSVSDRSAFTNSENLEPFPGSRLVRTWATRLKIPKIRPNRSQQIFMDWDYIQCVPSRGRHPKQAFRHFILK